MGGKRKKKQAHRQAAVGHSAAAASLHQAENRQHAAAMRDLAHGNVAGAMRHEVRQPRCMCVR